MPEKRPVGLGDWIDNRYEVFDVLKGGMGVVFIVYDHEGEFGRRVLALKTVRDEFLLDNKQVMRFISEIKTWIKLDRHPNIVRAYSVQLIDGTPYVVLELVTGGDLRRWLKTQTMTLPQALRFGIQFCLGMEHALRMGLYCHRDIKPENLLITVGGTLKITDFGLAKVRDEKIHGQGNNDPIPVAGEELPYQTATWPDITDQPVNEASQDRARPIELDDPASDDPLRHPWALAQEELGITSTMDWMPTEATEFRDPRIEQTIDFTPETIDLTPETVDLSPEAVNLKSPEKGEADRNITQEGAILGTATYMAPEQFLNAKHVNYLADLYSFGVVLFEMIANRPPFQATTFAKIKRQHANTAPPSLVPFIPNRYARYANAINKIVRRCLEKNPAKRYPTFADLRLALSKALWWVARERVELPTQMEFDAWELTSRGVALGTFGRYKEERECYEDAIRIKPDYVPAWFNLAAAFGTLDEPREAIEYANMALHLNPGSVPALINKGLALHVLNRPDKALACFDTAVHLQPREPAIWKGRALVLYGQGNTKGAEAAIHQLHRLSHEGEGMMDLLSGKTSPGSTTPAANKAHPIPWIRRTEDTLAESTKSR